MKSISKDLVVITVGILLLSNVKTFAHCEIPCGIYEDELRIELIKEDITTIEKSMKMIIELSKESEINYNQLVRWINNKEEHSVKIQNIVSQYFLNQRIKIKDMENEEDYKKYTTQLVLLHKMLVFSMKCKQTTDLSFIKKLRETVTAFEKAYFQEHD